MVPKKGEPRNFLVDPKKFGDDPDAPWKPFSEEDKGRVGAAFHQHLVVVKARKRLAAKGFFNVTAFGKKLGDPQGVQKKFAGSRRAQMADYLLWAYHLDRRGIITTWERNERRERLFPYHLVAGEGEGRGGSDSTGRDAQKEDSPHPD